MPRIAVLTTLLAVLVGSLHAGDPESARMLQLALEQFRQTAEVRYTHAQPDSASQIRYLHDKTGTLSALCWDTYSSTSPEAGSLRSRTVNRHSSLTMMSFESNRAAIIDDPAAQRGESLDIDFFDPSFIQASSFPHEDENLVRILAVISPEGRERLAKQHVDYESFLYGNIVASKLPTPAADVLAIEYIVEYEDLKLLSCRPITLSGPPPPVILPDKTEYLDEPENVFSIPDSFEVRTFGDYSEAQNFIKSPKKSG